MIKTIFKVNTGTLVGFGYRLDEISFRIKTINGVKDHFESDIKVFTETKKTISVNF